jgi:glycine/D-amino acid oxidase-like deaminating enzyme
LWEYLAAQAVQYPQLSKARQSDLVVVGAGFLGLSTALEAARRGLSVTVLEAAEPGFGASGRNTGLVVPSLKSLIGPAEAIRDLGEGHAQDLLGLVAQSGSDVFDLIRREGIDCQAEQRGWLQPGHSAAAEQTLLSRLPALQAAGVEVNFLTRDAMRAQTGLPSLHGGLRMASGGQINPLAYARGLADAAARAGADVFSGTPVLKIVAKGTQWCVETPGGSVTADRIILATNAMAQRDLAPSLKASLIPVRVFQIATQVLPEHLRSSILPSGAPIADSRRHTFALRWSPDGRLVTGGMATPMPGRMEVAKRSFLRRLERWVPGLPPLKAEYAWSGTIAGTPDFLPRMIKLAPNLYGAIGCNGRGVALTTALGREIAELCAGIQNEADFVLPITPPRTIPFSRLAGAAPHLWLPWSNLADAYETHRPPT